jgi:hypothetical protein
VRSDGDSLTRIFRNALPSAVALFYVCVDMYPGRVWPGSPFVYPGMNSLTVYTLSEVLELVGCDCVARVSFLRHCVVFPTHNHPPLPPFPTPHTSFSNLFPFKATLDGQFANHSQAMASNLFGITCFVCLARWMYLRKVFINV